MAFKICGPKSVLCMLILSAMGVVILSVVGILFRFNCATFAEDLMIEEIEEDFVTKMNDRYKELAYNCLIAAGLYGITLGVAIWQYNLNRRDGSMDALF
ncbi:ribonuclease kappa [Trichonephila clavata]|uniref:Ribonuclease kappa n=1 Tax=Trichonephila clavata TaxID=2740835 RepID=A0A8X6FSA3_TRICU|nr:ribonuclease kappa [Trichonephila clavata]